MNKRSNKIALTVISIVLVITIGIIVFLKTNNKEKIIKGVNIDNILKSESYDYLPIQAKSYIKQVYNETGKVILTEKNKKENEAYLNPAYVNYLANNETNTSIDSQGDNAENEKVSFGYVPSPMTIDFDYSKIGAGVSNDLPDQYDLRDVGGKSYVSSIKSQNPYELSWAFAYSGALESKFLKSYNLNSVDFSERQMDYARSDASDTINIGVNPYTTPMTNNLLTDAGNINVFSKNILFGISPIYEDKWNHKYMSVDRLSPEDVWNFENVDYDVDEFYVFYKSTKNSKEDLIKLVKQKIIDNGSLGITVNYNLKLKYPVLGSGQKALKFGLLNNMLLYQDESTPEFYNQVVQLIGWDDNYQYTICFNDNELKTPILNKCSDGFIKKEIKGAWIIQNSWGELSEPYSYLAYDSSVGDFVSFNSINKKTWDNEYNYNFTNVDKNIASNQMEFKYNAITKEKLEKIRFYANLSLENASSKKFNIYLSTTGKDSDYKLITSKSVLYNGLYTIDLSSKNIILNGYYKLKFVLNNYTFYADEISLFTSNVNNNIRIKIDDVKNTDNNYIRSLVDEDNVVMLNGKSRNLKISDKIDYKIFSNGVDVTNKFKYNRNYSVSNVVNTLISYNSSDIKPGKYNAEVYVNGSKYDEFIIIIEKTVNKMAGSGTIKDPFVITDKYQLNSIRNSTNYYYKLENDIVFEDSDYQKGGLFYNGGKYFEPIGPNVTFKGNIENNLTNKLVNSFNENIDIKLDGNNKKIINLKINRPNEDYVGLFRGIYNENNSATVSNITFENASIVGRNIVGVLSGVASSGVTTNTDTESFFELNNIKIDNSVVIGNNYVGQLSGVLEIQSSNSSVYEVLESLMGNAVNISNINILNSNKKSKVEGNNYVGGVFGIVKSIEYSNNYKNMKLSDISNFVDVISLNGYAAGITSKVVMHSKDINFSLNDSSNYGNINGKKCSAQILCEADLVNEKNVYGNVNFHNVYYETGYGFLNGKAVISSSNSVLHSLKTKKDIECKFTSGDYTFSKKDKYGNFYLECNSGYGFDNNVSLKKSDFTFTFGILTNLFKAKVSDVSRTEISSDNTKVRFRVTVKSGLFSGKTTLILPKGSIKDSFGNSNAKVKSKTISITK